MAVKKYRVALDENQRNQLKQLTQSGTRKARDITRARILLLADENRDDGGKTDRQIAQALGVSIQHVFTIRHRYACQGINEAIVDKPRSGRPKTFTGKNAATVTALACSTPPGGNERWTLRLLAEKLVELSLVESISYNSVRNILKKTNCRHT